MAILDRQMPDLNGLEAARRVPSRSPGTRVIMLSMHGEEPFVRKALRYGVMGYVLKGDATRELLAAVQTVMAGRRFLSAVLNERVLAAYVTHVRDVEEPLERYDLLTNREREVLHLSAQGMTYAEIGERLAISPRTAETHRGKVLRKLGPKDQTELVRFALSRGLLTEG